MRTAIVHIGHGKTGTSFIQSSLALNQSALRKLSISYPTCSSFDDAIKGLTTSGNGELFERGYDIQDSDFPSLLFSGENLFHTLVHSDGLILKKSLGNKFDQLKIVLYTRDVLDMLVSTWGQLVKKMGATIGLDEYLESGKDRHHLKVLSWIKLSKLPFG